MKRNSYKRRSRRTAIIVAAIAVAAAALAISAVAVFTTSYRARRVLAAYETNDQLFSSNYMRVADSRTTPAASVYVDDSGTWKNTSVTVTVCNYAQNHPEIAFGAAIEYTVSAKLYDRMEANDVYAVGADAGVTISGMDHVSNSGSWTYTHTLYQTDAMGLTIPVHDEFEISFNDDTVFANRYYLHLTAVPAEGLRAVLQPISVWINVLKTPQIHQSRWMLQREETDHAASDYYGFNFIYSGSGAGTTVLSWDSDKLALSDVSRRELKDQNGYAVSADTNPVTFYVSDEKPSYTLQFYPIGNAFDSWPVIGRDVTAVFSPDGA